MAAMPTSPSYSVLGGKAPLTPTIPCEWSSTPLSPTEVVSTDEAEGYSEHPEAASSTQKDIRNRAGRKKANRHRLNVLHS